MHGCSQQRDHILTLFAQGRWCRRCAQHAHRTARACAHVGATPDTKQRRTCVMASASSRSSSLYGGQGYCGSALPTLALANTLILSRTTLMPRSSDALSSSTRAPKSLGLQSDTVMGRLASATHCCELCWFRAAAMTVCARRRAVWLRSSLEVSTLYAECSSRKRGVQEAVSKAKRAVTQLPARCSANHAHQCMKVVRLRHTHTTGGQWLALSWSCLCRVGHRTAGEASAEAIWMLLGKSSVLQSLIIAHVALQCLDQPHVC